MYVISRKKKKSFFVIRVVLAAVLLVLAVNVLYLFVQQRIRIADRATEFENLQTQLSEQTLANNELRAISENEDMSEYMERVARESLNYAYPGEYVYINVAGVD